MKILLLLLLKNDTSTKQQIYLSWFLKNFFQLSEILGELLRKLNKHRQEWPSLYLIFFPTLRQGVLTEHHTVGTEVTTNDADPFAAAEKRKRHRFSNAPLREPTLAFSKCSEYCQAADVCTLAPESTLFGVSNHSTVRCRYFTLITVILKGVLWWIYVNISWIWPRFQLWTLAPRSQCELIE